MPENTQKEKEEQLHFACIVPSPRQKLLIAKRELPGSKEFPLPGEKGGCSASPAFCGHCTKKDPLWIHPTQRPEKLRWIEDNLEQEKGSGNQYEPHGGSDHSS